MNKYLVYYQRRGSDTTGESQPFERFIAHTKNEVDAVAQYDEYMKAHGIDARYITVKFLAKEVAL